jgi:hypothetical protein
VIPTFSSLPKDQGVGIPYGDDWFKWIEARIRESGNVVALITHASIGRPWILFEAGFGRAIEGVRVFGLRLGTSGEDAYVGPFRTFQHSASSPDDLLRLCKQLFEGTACSPRDELVLAQIDKFLHKVKAHFSDADSMPVKVANRPQEPRGTSAIVSIINLDEGIRFWHEQKPNWPRDFHASFYLELASLREHGLTKEWWQDIVPHLSSWRAIRPLSNQQVKQRGLERLESLHAVYSPLMQTMGSVTAFSDLEWGDVTDLFEVARSIKGSQSPVFGSKLCHFILPSAFPVIDGEAVGSGCNYEFYWTACRDSWLRCTDKKLLISRLQKEIGSNQDYPWETKITELCMIGKNQTT